MGLNYSAPQYQNPDLVLDYTFHLFKPTAPPIVHIKKGPKFGEIHPDQSEEIHLTLIKLIESGDNYNKSLYKQYCCAYCCVSLFTLPCWILIPTLASLGAVYWFTGDYFDQYKSYTYLVIGVIIIITCIQCYCYCCTAKGLNKSAIKWRNNTIQIIDENTKQWIEQWPEFSMTIIYPIIIRGRKGKTRGIRGILRISKGTQPQNNPLQPIYRQYLSSPTAELVTLNMPQQQIIHQRTATPVLLQGANGQQIIVQGQKAVLNGQQVIITPQLHQHLVPMHQPEIAISTDSNQVAYAPIPASAPPAYNPNVIQQPELELAKPNEEGGIDNGIPAETMEYYHQ